MHNGALSCRTFSYGINTRVLEQKQHQAQWGVICATEEGTKLVHTTTDVPRMKVMSMQTAVSGDWRQAQRLETRWLQPHLV
jgi:hypothetical protein